MKKAQSQFGRCCLYSISVFIKDEDKVRCWYQCPHHDISREVLPRMGTMVADNSCQACCCLQKRRRRTSESQLLMT